MLRKRTVVVLIVMPIIMAFCLIAWSEPNPKQAIAQGKSGKLTKQKRTDQITPPPNFITNQQLIDAISQAIEATAYKAKATQNPPSPDTSPWYFSLFLVIFTGGLVAVGIAQCYIIFKTLRETQIVAKAATNSAEVAENALISGKRAYVFVKDVLRNKEPSSDYPLTEIWNIRVVWENTGDTPTKDMLGNVNFDFFVDKIPDDFDYPDRGKEKFRVVIGPKHTIKSYIPIPVHIIDEAFAKSHRVYMWGWVDYNDVFKDTPRHRTEFCHEIRQIGNDLSFNIYGKYNGSDDECYRKPSPYTHTT
jgi:hypothetical protein